MVAAGFPLVAFGTYPETLELLTCHKTFVYPDGAAGVVPLKFGFVTAEPLTLTEEPPAALSVPDVMLRFVPRFSGVTVVPPAA